MPKIKRRTLETLRLRKRRLEQQQYEATVGLMHLQREIEDIGPFCDRCGETHPPSGFYPLYSFGPSSLTGMLCNDCDRAMRERE